MGQRGSPAIKSQSRRQRKGRPGAGPPLPAVSWGQRECPPLSLKAKAGSQVTGVSSARPAAPGGSSVRSWESHGDLISEPGPQGQGTLQRLRHVRQLQETQIPCRADASPAPRSQGQTRRGGCLAPRALGSQALAQPSCPGGFCLPWVLVAGRERAGKPQPSLLASPPEAVPGSHWQCGLTFLGRARVLWPLQLRGSPAGGCGAPRLRAAPAAPARGVRVPPAQRLRCPPGRLPSSPLQRRLRVDLCPETCLTPHGWEEAPSWSAGSRSP